MMTDLLAGLPAPPSLEMLKLQMLRWIAEAPRTYAETMEAWRTSCPRLSVWEDAVAEDLVRLVSAAVDQSASAVRLTELGAAQLATSDPTSSHRLQAPPPRTQNPAQ